MTLKLAETSVAKSRPSVPYVANLFCRSYRSVRPVSLSVRHTVAVPGGHDRQVIADHCEWSVVIQYCLDRVSNVRPSVRPSVKKKFLQFRIFNEIWDADTGR